MTRQITVRLDDDLVDYMDAHTDNRTAYVAEALEHERRRRMAEEDIIALSMVPAEVADEIAAITTAAPKVLDVE